MAQIDKLKEEIGWLKVIFAIYSRFRNYFYTGLGVPSQ